MNDTESGNGDLTSPPVSTCHSVQQVQREFPRRSARQARRQHPYAIRSLRQSQQPSPQQSPAQSSSRSSIESPQQSPAQSPSQTPVQSPQHSPAQSPSQSSIETPQQSPAQSPSHSSVPSTSDSPVVSLLEVESLIDNMCNSVNVFNVLVKHINSNELTFGKEIGRGTKGSIYEVFFDLNGLKVKAAAKIIHCNSYNNIANSLNEVKLQMFVNLLLAILYSISIYIYYNYYILLSIIIKVT